MEAGDDKAGLDVSFSASVYTVAGVEVGSFPLGDDATVLDLKLAIADTGGPPVNVQHLLIGARDLDDDAELLGPAVAVAAGDASVATASFTVVEMQRQNLALASLGAVLAQGEWGEGQMKAQKPLLRHDDAFPVEMFGADFEGLPEDRVASSRALLGEHLAVMDSARWKSDCGISTFLPREAELVVRLRDRGGRIARVGFTYSPWDRNYGRICVVEASEDGKDYVELGRLSSPYVTEQGGSTHSPKTIFLEVPQNLARTRFNFVRWSWPAGEGRRVFFVYVYGYA
eukprot:TRINITY_DN13719_c0_g1_i1.p1 TRINITY_DN13719_c0_g1~~TRINITY_DN13719_c0_g1_i1.p1  ORF type:complete len:311 (-),score=39.94 TRINITY_DN13719_c0_g1_i1:14-868(-)